MPSGTPSISTCRVTGLVVGVAEARRQSVSVVLLGVQGRKQSNLRRVMIESMISLLVQPSARRWLLVHLDRTCCTAANDRSLLTSLLLTSRMRGRLRISIRTGHQCSSYDYLLATLSSLVAAKKRAAAFITYLCFILRSSGSQKHVPIMYTPFRVTPWLACLGQSPWEPNTAYGSWRAVLMLSVRSVAILVVAAGCFLPVCVHGFMLVGSLPLER